MAPRYCSAQRVWPGNFQTPLHSRVITQGDQREGTEYSCAALYRALFLYSR